MSVYFSMSVTTLNDGSTGSSSLIFFEDSSFLPVDNIKDIVNEPTNQVIIGKKNFY